MPEAIQSKLGVWNIQPVFKVTNSRRPIELNCAEQAFKQSFMLRSDFDTAIMEKIGDKLLR